MLRLHLHQHTQDEPSTSFRSKAVLSAQHHHCHAEQLYDAPFQPAEALTVPLPLQRWLYAAYRLQAAVCRAAHLLDGASLRGPPVQRA